MRNFKSEGIIIKRRNFGEADRIITIFTKHHGKIQAKAMGVRKITSRRSSHMELLNLVSFNFYKGRIMPLVLETQTVENFSGMKDDLTKIGFAFHICELVDGLCPENQESQEIFFLLHTTLKRLERAEDIVEIIHSFEIKLLTFLGFWKQGSVQTSNTRVVIEEILERKLKSRQLFVKLS